LSLGLKTRFYANHFFNSKDKILRQTFYLVLNDKLLRHCSWHKLDCDGSITAVTASPLQLTHSLSGFKKQIAVHI